MKTFITIERPAEGEIKERGSRFISYLFEIQNEEEAKTRLREIRSLHPKATHVCYAYRLGITGEVNKAADSGEPSGSAGMPILNQLRSVGLTNIICLVVRYYGRTKLGIPGLNKAYKDATRNAIDHVRMVERNLTKRMIIEVEFLKVNEVIHVLKMYKIDKFEIEQHEGGSSMFFQINEEIESQILQALNRYILNFELK
jgi:uncharacterized YigZ family protein